MTFVYVIAWGFQATRNWGGDQTPLMTSATIVLVAILGVAILVLVTPFFFTKWFRRYWYVNVLFFIVTIPSVLKVVSVSQRYPYSLVQ